MKDLNLIALINAVALKIAVIAAVFFMASCGKDNEKDAAEGEPEAVTGSIYLASKKDLPECSEKNETQLAYLKKEKEFYVCEANEWQVTEIETDSKATAKEAASDRTLSSNEWRDPITGSIWAIAGNSNGTAAETACKKPFRAPESAELIAALENGMEHKAKELGITLLEFWSAGGNKVGPTKNFVMYLNTKNWHENSTLLKYTKIVVCIEE